MNKATNPYGDGQACKRIIEKKHQEFQTTNIRHKLPSFP